MAPKDRGCRTTSFLRVASAPSQGPPQPSIFPALEHAVFALVVSRRPTPRSTTAPGQGFRHRESPPSQAGRLSKPARRRQRPGGRDRGAGKVSALRHAVGKVCGRDHALSQRRGAAGCGLKLIPRSARAAPACWALLQACRSSGTAFKRERSMRRGICTSF